MRILFDQEFRPEGEKVFRVKVSNFDGGISLSVGSRTKSRGHVEAMNGLTKSQAKALCHALLETTKD